MAQTITGITKTKILTNLDTYNHTTLASGMYTVRCTLSEQPPSGVILTIQQNSVTKATTTTIPAAAQEIVDLQIVLNCAINDIISIIISSSNPTDTGKNVIKAILNIHQGSV